MSDRDWAKELSKIDKQLESVSDEALFPTKAAATPAARAQASDTQARVATWGVVARLLLSTALGVGILFWPYEARCGLGLAGYLGAVGAVTLGGVWSAVWSWRHRAGRAHSLALLLALWGIVLAAMEVLPRTGYANPAVAGKPVTWACPAELPPG